MRGPDIFISYARGDQGTARLFAESFAREGFSVWWDAAIHSGETFDEVIEKELRSARAVVVLWSPRAVLSRWVRAEATLADRKKTLAPVIIEPCDRPIIFELTHTVDLSHWTGDRSDRMWKIFVNDLHRLVGEPAQTGPAAGPATGPATGPAAGTATGGHPAGEASSPQPAPSVTPPASAAFPVTTPDGKQFTQDNVDSLLSALASLQKAMEKPGESIAPYLFTPTAEPAPSPPAPAAEPATKAAPLPAPPPPHEFEESEATQFYTGTDEYALLMGDELHCLELSGDAGLEQRFIVGPLGLKVGRSAPAEVILVDSKVSRSHCLVELKDGELYVSDLNSTNGTFVDGTRVTGAAVLPAGATLMVGRFSLVHEVRKRNEI